MSVGSGWACLGFAVPIPTLADVLNLLPLLGVGLVVFLGSVIAMTVHRLTHPPRRGYAWAVSKGVPGDPAELDTPLAFTERTETHAGRRVALWDIKGGDADGPVLVLTHGWGWSRVHALDRIAALAPSASRLVAWDMPGHGDSAGATSLGRVESRCLASIVRELGDANVVLWGWSLGAEVTLHGAGLLTRSGSPPGGVVLEAAFRRGLTPARGVLRAAGYPRGFTLTAALAVVGARHGDPRDRFRDLTSTASLLADRPLLVLHGAHDQIAPIEDGRAIAEAGRGRLVRFDDAGHELWTETHTERCADAIRGFVRTAGAGAGADVTARSTRRA